MSFAPDQTWTFTAPTVARCCSCRTGIDPGTEWQRGTRTSSSLSCRLRSLLVVQTSAIVRLRLELNGKDAMSCI